MKQLSTELLSQLCETHEKDIQSFGVFASFISFSSPTVCCITAMQIGQGHQQHRQHFNYGANKPFKKHRPLPQTQKNEQLRSSSPHIPQ